MSKTKHEVIQSLAEDIQKNLEHRVMGIEGLQKAYPGKAEGINWEGQLYAYNKSMEIVSKLVSQHLSYLNENE